MLYGEESFAEVRDNLDRMERGNLAVNRLVFGWKRAVAKLR